LLGIDLQQPTNGVEADRWLFVVSRTGQAVANRWKYRLRAGTLVLIERGDMNEVKNAGDENLVMLNFYVSPTCADDGHELPTGKS
jgi:hypothetical protein